MTRKPDDQALRTRIRDISLFYRKRGRMPSFSEVGELVGFRSKNAVSRLVRKLEGVEDLRSQEDLP